MIDEAKHHRSSTRTTNDRTRTGQKKRRSHIKWKNIYCVSDCPYVYKRECDVVVHRSKYTILCVQWKGKINPYCDGKTGIFTEDQQRR